MERSGTIDKALRVLTVLEKARAPLSLAEIARSLSIPKPTTHRLLASLLEPALVEQQADGRYALGMGLVRLGLGALSVDPLVRVAQRELEAAAAALGETFFLVKARGGKLVVLSKVEGTGLLRVAPNVGAEVPVDVTASGRLYLAFAPGVLADGKGAKRVSAEAVKRAKSRGYDVNDEEWLSGMTVIAAPILVHGELLGCVTCAGPAVRLVGANRKLAIESTCEVAARVATHLGDTTRA